MTRSDLLLRDPSHPACRGELSVCASNRRSIGRGIPRGREKSPAPQGIAPIARVIAILKERYTIVVVTHNMAQARRISDQSVFMMLGEVFEQGPTAAMFATPQRTETRAYLEGLYG